MDIQWLIEELGLDFLPQKFLIYQGFILAPTLYGLVHYKRLSRPYKLLVQILILVFAKAWVGRWSIAQIGTTTPVSHFLVLIHLTYYGWIYYLLLKGFSVAQRVILFCTIAFLLFSMFNSFYTGLMIMPSIGIVLISILVVTGSLLLYHYELQNPVEIPIFRQPVFWFNSGNLIFYGTTIFVFGFFNYMTYEMGGLTSWMDALIAYTNYMLYSFYLVSLYLAVGENRAKHLVNER